jgi:uncharacterized glyoxalase superfamily protein PhnB/DNA-binding XRE family transcriptional regulator
MSRVRDKRAMQTRIRELREKKAWTQEQLAAAARISTRTVQRAEDGVMAAETRSAIAGALDVPVEALAAEVKPAIQPVLIYEDSKAAFTWLQEAFGFTARERVADDDGQVVHGELVLGQGVVMVTRAGGKRRWVSPKGGQATGFLYVFVDDVEAHFDKARKAGATIVADLEISYGQKRYRCLDLEGHEWCFSQEVGA